MPISAIEKDFQKLTMRVDAEFAVPVSRLWSAFADPRQLDLFWGYERAQGHFIRHDFCAGGRSEYFLGQRRKRHYGYWNILRLDRELLLEIQEGELIRGDLTPDPDRPVTRIVFEFKPAALGSRLIATCHFLSLQDMEDMLDDEEDSATFSVNALEALVTGPKAYDFNQPTTAQRIGSRRIRVSRLFPTSAEDLWRALHEPDQLRQWMVGPQGYRLTNITTASDIGAQNRYVWEPETGFDGLPFAITGQVLEQTPPHHEVTEEALSGSLQAPTRTVKTLVEIDPGTLLTQIISYQDRRTRDRVLNSGLAKSMEAGYIRIVQNLLRSGRSGQD